MSPPTTGHQKGQKRSGVSVGKPFFPVLSERGDCKYQGMSVRTCFHANVRKSDLHMVNLEWNMTQKPDPTLEPSNYRHLPKKSMFSAENLICPRRVIRDGPERLHTCSTCMSNPRYYLRGVPLFSPNIWSYVRSTYVYVHTYLEKECRIINQFGSCTLRPLRLLYCCFPLNRRQISSDITSSPLFATASKT